MVTVNAPAVDGRANDELVEFLAEYFGVNKRYVSILRGEKGKEKTVQIEGSVTSGFNTSLGTGFGNDRANQVLANPYLPNKGVNGWLNPAAFARPADGVWGNASLNIQGPGFITLNMGLTRKFRVSERQSVEFRAEAFNMPNHLNPNNPVFALNSRDFGKILMAGDPRIMQFALKYLF